MTLQDEHCKECKKHIKVCFTSPDDDEEDATGMSANRWGDDYQEYFVGWICNECAWSKAATKGGGGMIGYSGPYQMDFVYD